MLNFISNKLTTSGFLSNLIKPNKTSSYILLIKRSLKEPDYPALNENEIREIFSKGSGPGGQKLNKATNRCDLKHSPTGITVSSHHTRSLEENRKIARKLLQQKLDLHYNNENSYLYKLNSLKQEKKFSRTKRSVENLKRKKEFKEREDIE